MKWNERGSSFLKFKVNKIQKYFGQENGLECVRCSVVCEVQCGMTGVVVYVFVVITWMIDEISNRFCQRKIKYFKNFREISEIILFNLFEI